LSTRPRIKKILHTKCRPFRNPETALLRYACLFIVALTCSAIAAVDATAADEPVAPTVVVQSFVRAYNAHDLDAIAKLLTEDVQWHALDRDAVATKANNRSELLQQLAAYFQEYPNARSVLEQSIVSGPYVAVRERAFWKREGKTMSAASLAVYQTVNGRVARAWYYPAEKP
jgi:hypothetical protein